jgi:hypothetical protein
MGNNRWSYKCRSRTTYQTSYSRIIGVVISYPLKTNLRNISRYKEKQLKKLRNSRMNMYLYLMGGRKPFRLLIALHQETDKLHNDSPTTLQDIRPVVIVEQ